MSAAIPAGYSRAMKKLSIGSWAFLFNQETPTTDFHDLIHHLFNLGYDGVELGGFLPSPMARRCVPDMQQLLGTGAGAGFFK